MQRTTESNVRFSLDACTPATVSIILGTVSHESLERAAWAEFHEWYRKLKQTPGA